MPGGGYGQAALNLATGIVTLSAVLMAGIRVREAFFPNPSLNRPDTVPVADWREYGSEGIRIGPEHAALTIVVFVDLECPFCEKAEQYLRDLRGRYPTEVAVVYRHLPKPGNSMAASIASQCAASYNAFEEFVALFFAKGNSGRGIPWSVLAQSAGIADSMGFEACLREDATADLILLDTLAATTLGVSGTPTFLLNDLLVPGFLGSERMDSLVEGALQKVRGAHEDP